MRLITTVRERNRFGLYFRTLYSRKAEKKVKMTWLIIAR
jgi:hypothetical protein